IYVSMSGVSLDISLIYFPNILYFFVIVIFYIFKFTLNKFFFFIFTFFFFNFKKNFSNRKFLEIGNIKKNPKISVAKPGMINSRAAKAIAAPEITSYVGALFFLI